MRLQFEFADSVRLPSGRRFNPRRPRSAGPLDAEELAWCRAHGVPLAADPVQSGMVVLDCPDDLEDAAVALPRGAAAAGPAVAFRRWAAQDLPAFRALLDDPRVWRHLPEPYPDPLTEAAAAALIALANDAPHHEVRAVIRDGVPVGQVRIAFPPGSADRQEAELSYWLGAAHWGRGIGTAAVSAFVAQCFRRHPGLAALVARVHRDNAASARVLARAGFRRAGPGADAPEIVLFRLNRQG